MSEPAAPGSPTIRPQAREITKGLQLAREINGRKFTAHPAQPHRTVLGADDDVRAPGSCWKITDQPDAAGAGDAGREGQLRDRKVGPALSLDRLVLPYGRMSLSNGRASLGSSLRINQPRPTRRAGPTLRLALGVLKPRVIARLKHGGVGRRSDVVLDPIVAGETVFVDEAINIAAARAAKTGFAHATVDQLRAAMAARGLGLGPRRPRRV